MNIARFRKTRAFTLIELIVVIVIMGILVAIGAFAYNAIIKSSRADAVSKVASQVAKTIQAHSAANQTAYADINGTTMKAVTDDDLPAANNVRIDNGTTTTPAVLPTNATSFTVRNTNTGCSATVTFATGTSGTAIGSAPTNVSKGTC
jgi:prepilin-type N-terminal cleavage/methylation domain-containing protein